MELEIICREIIKPSIPTPPELRHLDLCLFDRRAPYLYMQFLYFFENGGGFCSRGSVRNNSGRLLKESLSKALTHYYPFAGRFRDGVSVDCNDMGVTFLEAKLGCEISEVMDENLNRTEILNLLCSDDLNGKDHRFNPLLSVQLTRFKCGGEVICVSLSHRIADASTLATFMNDWASIARSSGDPVPPVSPHFNAASLFPAAASAVPPGWQDPIIVKREENIVSKRFVFEASKIAKLKAMVSERVENPSRVEVLAALIYKALISSTSRGSKTQPASSLIQLVNLRTRMVPPLPASSTGNIISFCVASSSTTEEQREIELWRLVADMKGNMKEFCNKHSRRHKAGDWASVNQIHMEEIWKRLRNPVDQTHYVCSSYCRFGLYEADFGWGKPTWITADILSKNAIVLMDARDGEGIEALVSLEMKEMAALERNEELLSFCQLKSYHHPNASLL